jgi:hypothetical protein
MDPPSTACLHAALKKSPSKEQSRTAVDLEETSSEVLQASLLGVHLAHGAAQHELGDDHAPDTCRSRGNTRAGRRGLAAQLAGLCSGPHEPPQDAVVVPKVVIGAGNRVLARVGRIQ